MIQNIETGKYIKHNGNYDPEQYCYDDVEKQEDADMFEKWRVIDTNTGVSYTKDENRKFVREATA